MRFYKTGVDITNDKQMFNFLKNHFEYWTMNSWNRLSSVANKVKLYDLDLAGDWAVALSLLEAGEYDEISRMIMDWERENPGYEARFNGRCGGYLVLTDKGSHRNILPDEITDCDTYAIPSRCPACAARLFPRSWRIPWRWPRNSRLRGV